MQFRRTLKALPPLLLIAATAYSQSGQSGQVTYLNEGSTGTSLSLLVTLTSSRAIVASHTVTGGIVGIAVSGTGTTGTVTIATAGKVRCQFDGPTVAGDYVQNSPTIDGFCHDAGAAVPTTGQVLGQVTSANGASGAYLLDMTLRQTAGGLPSNNPVVTGTLTVGTTILSACGGVDDTVLIQAAMDATGTVQLPTGTCVVSNLIPTRNVQLRGWGPTTILSYKSGATGWLLDGSTFGVRLEGLVLDGGLTSTQAASVAGAGTRSGVQFTATVRDSGAYNVTVRGFSNLGVGLNGTTTLMQATPVLSNVNAYYNWVGIQTRVGASGTAGEYTRITGGSVADNRYGLIILSGNTTVVGNTFNNNGYNIQILNDTNNAHGNLVGNTINHATVYGLDIENVSNGFVITGNQFWFSDWFINGSAGLTITGNTIAIANMTLTGQGNGANTNTLRNNYMGNPATGLIPVLTGGSGWSINDNLQVDGNYFQGKHTADSTVSTVAQSGASEMVTNGSFATGANWTLGVWAVSGGVASITSATGLLIQNMASVTAGLYLVTFTISGYSAGGIAIGIGGASQTFKLTTAGNGTFTIPYTLTATGDKNLYIIPQGTSTYSISGVSVKLATNVFTSSFKPPTSCTASGTVWNNAGALALCP